MGKESRSLLLIIIVLLFSYNLTWSNSSTENMGEKIMKNIQDFSSYLFGPTIDPWEKLLEEKEKNIKIAEKATRKNQPEVKYKIKNILDIIKMDSKEIIIKKLSVENRSNNWGKICITDKKGNIINDTKTIYKALYYYKAKKRLMQLNSKEIIENLEKMRTLLEKVNYYHSLADLTDNLQIVASKLLAHNLTGGLASHNTMLDSLGEGSDQILIELMRMLAREEVGRWKEMLNESIRNLKRNDIGSMSYEEILGTFAKLSYIISNKRDITKFAEATFPGFNENMGVRTIKRVTNDVISVLPSWKLKERSLNNLPKKNYYRKLLKIKKVIRNTNEITANILSLLGTIEPVMNYQQDVQTQNSMINEGFVLAEANYIKNIVGSPINVEDNFVYVKGGEFKMGSRNGDDDEEPVHKVKVDSFYISKYEVTHEEFIKFLNSAGVSGRGKLHGNEVIDMDDSNCAVEHGSSFYFDGSDEARSKRTPAIEVTWYGAVEYCNWLSRKHGLTPVYTINGSSVSCNWNVNGYRLPTEAEWEYAAKGGQKSRGYKYSGDSSAGSVAWYGDNSGDRTHSVGKKKSNELGIYDMSGNVWEWCWDWFDDDYYSSSSYSNPKGPSSGSGRVERGGSWDSFAYFVRSAYRFFYTPSDSDVNLGFRLARNPE